MDRSSIWYCRSVQGRVSSPPRIFSNRRTLIIVLYAGWLLAIVGCGDDARLAVGIPVAGPEHARQLAEDQLRFNQLRATCLQERGFDATASAQGVHIEHRGQPSELVRKQVEECEVELLANGLVPTDPKDLESYLSDVYDYYLSLTDCLRQRGIAVGDPPSRETFIDSGGGWTPYLFVQPSDIAKLEQECPQSMRAS